MSCSLLHRQLCPHVSWGPPQRPAVREVEAEAPGDAGKDTCSPSELFSPAVKWGVQLGQFSYPVQPPSRTLSGKPHSCVSTSPLG